MANRKTAKKHALKRAKSRLGINNPNELAVITEYVLQNGTRVIDLPDGEIKDILWSKFDTNTRRKKIYFYNNHLFVFDNNKELITHYKFDIEKERVHYINKERHRNN